MSLRVLLVFTVTEFFLCLAPGPGVFLVVSQAMRNGFSASIRGTLGILTANAAFFALSAVGLGALLLASATLFEVIRWAGAAYLIVVGVKMLLGRHKTHHASEEARPRKRSVRLFSEGLFTQLSNPKAIVFFSALLPQFVTPGDRVAEQFLVLGVISIAVEFPILIGYGWAADRGSRLVLKGRFSTLVERIAGAFIIGAGVSLAAMRRL